MSEHAVVTREEWPAARGLQEGPGWNVVALDDTFTRVARDRDLVVSYYNQLIDQTPKGRQDELLAIRSDEYPEQ